MQVILLQRIEKLGQMGQMVDVKSGYARNFLLPQKKALRATNDNIAFFEKQKSVLEASNLEKKKDAEHAASKMNDVSVILIRQASETGVLYGSIRSKDIADALAISGYKINRAQVNILVPIKNLGIHTVQVALHPEVSVNVSVNVALSQEEALVQAGKASDAEEKTNQEA
ncbi:MAG TPA: 50S ribosomal protein L9 [Holosporales bacterium]|nr:50S ribosomal protein L9 [Holosporales bacterium]